MNLRGFAKVIFLLPLAVALLSCSKKAATSGEVPTAALNYPRTLSARIASHRCLKQPISASGPLPWPAI